jgi:hypothetical protein
LDINKFYQILFIDQTADYCTRCDRGECRLEYCSFIDCTKYFRMPSIWDKWHGYIVLSHCRFSGHPFPSEQWLKFEEDGASFLEEITTGMMVCVETSLGGECAIMDTCTRAPLNGPAATVARTPYPARTLPAVGAQLLCTVVLTGVQARMTPGQHLRVCCFDCTFTHVSNYAYNYEGAALNTNNNNCSISFDECTFSHLNVGSVGGAMLIRGTAAMVAVRQCCSDSTMSWNGAGGFAYVLSLSGFVTFHGLTSYLSFSATEGGVIWCAEAKTLIEYCNFSHCDTAMRYNGSYIGGGGGVCMRIANSAEHDQHHLVMYKCQTSGYQVGAGIKQVLDGAVGTTTWEEISFIGVEYDYCVHSEVKGTVQLERCSFVECKTYFRRDGAALVTVADSSFDGPLPVAVDGIVNCEAFASPDHRQTCLFEYSRLTECTVWILCETRTIGETGTASAVETVQESADETKSESKSESKWESKLETVPESAAASATETSTESAIDTHRDSAAESATESAIASPAAAVSSGGAVGSGAAASSGAAAGSGAASAASGAAGAASSGAGAGAVAGGSTATGTATLVLVVVVGVLAALIVLLILCFVLPALKKGGDRVENDESKEQIPAPPAEEVDHRAVPPSKKADQTPPVSEHDFHPESSSHAKQPWEELEPESELVPKRVEPESERVQRQMESESGRGQKQMESESGKGQKPAKGRPAASHRGGKVKKVRVEKAQEPSPVEGRPAVQQPSFEVSDAPAAQPSESGDGLRTITLEPVTMVAGVGDRSTQSIPFKEQIWTRQAYTAHLEPEHEGLWVSAARGFVDPGASEMPFNLFFEPKRVGSFDSTLVVLLGNFEIRVAVAASTGAGDKKRHRKHS